MTRANISPQTTRTPAFVQADWHSGRVVDRAGRTATAAEVLTALNAALAERDRLRAALADFVRFVSAGSGDERDVVLADLLDNASAALAQSDKGE